MVRHASRFAFAVILIGFALGDAAGRPDDTDDKDPIYSGMKASEWVKMLIEDKSARQRALAIDALSKLWADKRHKEGLSTIGRALRVDPSIAVRAQAALALGSLKDGDVKEGYAVDDLITSMGLEKESRVRKEIARAIGRYKDVPRLAIVQLTGALKDPDPATRVAVAEALTQAGKDAKSAAAGLAPFLADPDKSVRLAGVVALGRIAPEGASAIAETMAKMLATERDLDIKLELVTSLGLLAEKSPSVVAALAARLAEPEDDLRGLAARTLGVFGVASAPAAETLLNLARTDKSKDIRVDAVHGFGSALGPNLKDRIKDVISFLKDPEFEVRLAAVNEIGAIGNALINDKETIKTLRTLQSDSHVKVREAVGTAIKQIEKKPEVKKEPEPKKDPEPKKEP